MIVEKLDKPAGLFSEFVDHPEPEIIIFGQKGLTNLVGRLLTVLKFSEIHIKNGGAGCMGNIE